MELSRSSYIEIALMPVKRFYDYLKWKSELEEEKQKQMEEESAKIKAENKRLRLDKNIKF